MSNLHLNRIVFIIYLIQVTLAIYYQHFSAAKVLCLIIFKFIVTCLYNESKCVLEQKYTIFSNSSENGSVDILGKKLILTNNSKVILFMAANICNNLLGAGIIALPSAIKMSGYGLGIMFNGLCSGLCGITFIMLAYCGDNSKTDSFEDMVKTLLGKIAFYIATICTTIFPVICGMAYSIAIADNLQSFFTGMFPNISIVHHRAFLLFFPLYLMAFPMCMTKSMKYLEKVSTVSIFLVLLYVGSILTRLSTIPFEIQIIKEYFKFSQPTAIQALPIFAFASSCHHNAISFYKSRKDCTLRSFVISTNIGLFITFSLYLIVSISGYITFGGLPNDNLFVGYCSDDILINMMRVTFSLTIVLTLPLQLYSPKKVIMENILINYQDNFLVKSVVVLCLITICYLVATFSNNLSAVLEIGGALTNVPIVYIFPALCMLSTIGKPYYPTNIKTISCYLILVFGICMMFASPFFTIYSLFKTYDSKPTPNYYCEKR